MNQSKTCVVYYTHLLSDEILANYRKLKDESPAAFDVYFAYDNSRDDFTKPNGLSHKEIYLYKNNDLINRELRSSKGESSKIIPGNLNYIHLNFAQLHPEYEYIWRIEYDVFYTGNWNCFFSKFQDNKMDLLAASLLDYDQMPHWYWWTRFYSPLLPLVTPGIINCRIKSLRYRLLNHISPNYRRHCLPLTRHLVRCMLCVSRLNRRGVDLIEKQTRNGWRGHEEVLVPTLLRAGKLSFEDIGGTGRYVSAVNFNKNYSNNHNHSQINAGTLCTTPAIPPETITVKNMLHHPVKSGFSKLVGEWN